VTRLEPDEVQQVRDVRAKAAALSVAALESAEGAT
jgi:hypothetical protein